MLGYYSSESASYVLPDQEEYPLSYSAVCTDPDAAVCLNNNIDPSLCRLSPLPGYGLLQDCSESDPCGDSETGGTPTTPDDIGLAYAGHLSPQSSLLHLTGSHLLLAGGFDGAVPSFIDGRHGAGYADFPGFSDVAPTDAFAEPLHESYLFSGSALGNTDLTASYKPLDTGHTLHTLSSYDEESRVYHHPYQVSLSDGSFPTSSSVVHHMLSPKLLASVEKSTSVMSSCADTIDDQKPLVHLAKRHRGGGNRGQSSTSNPAVWPRRHRNRQSANNDTTKPSLKALAPSEMTPAAASGGTHHCHDCKAVFMHSTKLNEHRKKEHSRPFTCLFAFARCPASFSSKNEWKRHLMAQHIMHVYWICNDERCKKMRSAGGTHGIIGGAGEQSVSGVFNRKDLYTQHVRRMHMPEHLKILEEQYRKDKQANGRKTTKAKAVESGKGEQGKVKGKNKKRKREASVEEEDGAAETTVAPVTVIEPAELGRWNEELAALQDSAEVVRCHLPTEMICPACEQDFHDPRAWINRLEHVAVHMQQNHKAGKPSWPYGGASDPTLTKWAEDESVQIVRRCAPYGNGDGGPRWTLHELRQRVPGHVGAAAQQYGGGEEE